MASTRGDVGWEFGPGKLIGRIVYEELSIFPDIDQHVTKQKLAEVFSNCGQIGLGRVPFCSKDWIGLVEVFGFMMARLIKITWSIFKFEKKKTPEQAKCLQTGETVAIKKCAQLSVGVVCNMDFTAGSSDI